MEKTTNVLISVIFVPKYGNNYEIWAADLGGNLTIWDSNTKDCLFEFLWAKNEVKKREGKKGEKERGKKEDKKGSGRGKEKWEIWEGNLIFLFFVFF